MKEKTLVRFVPQARLPVGMCSIRLSASLRSYRVPQSLSLAPSDLLSCSPQLHCVCVGAKLPHFRLLCS